MKKILVLFFVLLSACAQAKIQELSSYANLNLSELTPETLVVFDIDNTLIRQNHMIGTHQWGDYISERAVRSGVPLDQAKQIQYKAFAEVQPSVQVVPVEEGVRSILAILNQKNVTHFALTARSAVLKDVTKKQLQILNHSFADSFPKQKDPELLKEYLDQGIIFSGSTPKGELLKQIIENSDIKFTKIIFIDDKLYNLESVEKSFEHSNIILQSYRYGAADTFVNSFNPQVADIEYSIFKEQHEIISDEEATSLVGHPQSIVDTNFEVFLTRQGPVMKSNGGCEEVKNLLFLCHYLYDNEMPFSFELELKQDAHTQGYFFGKW
jgi:FMN phosphatase YigB (HAD superfamily)